MCKTNAKREYSASSYVSFYQDDTDVSMFDKKIAVFNPNGTIDITDDLNALIIIHLMGSTGGNPGKRLWMSLVDYDKNLTLSQHISYSESHTTGVLCFATKLVQGTKLAVRLVDSFKMNEGLSGSYIQIIRL